MEIGDIFSVVPTFRLFGGVEAQNQLFYQLESFAAGWTGSGTALEAFAGEFEAYVVPFWRATYPAYTVLQGIRYFNLFNPGEVAESELELAGVVSASQPLNTWTAAAFVGKVPRRFRRDVVTRISGLDETQVEGNSLANSGAVLLGFDNLATALVTPLTVPPPAFGAVFRRVAIKRVKYLTSKGNEAWRLPETIAEADPVIVSEGAAKRPLAHQVTRR